MRIDKKQIFETAHSKIPWKTPWDFFLYLHHRQQAVAAEDVHFLCGSHRLTATGTNQFAGAAGSGRGRRGDASRCACPDAPDTESVVAAHVYIVPPLRNDEFNQCVCRLRDAPPDAAVIGDSQITGFGGGLEAFIVICPAPAGILDALLHIPEVAALMEQS